MARTIYDLGLDVSNRYAEDQLNFDESLIKDSRDIPQQTRITVTLPFLPTEFESLFGLGEAGTEWAGFMAPPNYYATKKPLFAQQIIPGFGTPDLQEIQLERVEAYGDEEKSRLPHEAEAVENEKQILLKLLGKIHKFDTELIDINSRRKQYQKG